jgi:hypothetical protein
MSEEITYWWVEFREWDKWFRHGMDYEDEIKALRAASYAASHNGEECIRVMKQVGDNPKEEVL